jgi:hypothetical protein
MPEVIDATPEAVNITGLTVGDDLVRTVELTGNFSTYTFKAQVRLDPTTLLNFTVTSPVFSSPKTTFTLKLPAAQSVQLTPGTTYKWDLQWVDPGGNTMTLMAGTVFTVEQVTVP